MASQRPSPDASRCPLVRVVGANANGLIAISSRELEVGSSFALGLHVSLPESRQSEFVTAETIIAACQPEGGEGEPGAYRVALVFSDISLSDRDLLELIAYDEALLSPRHGGSNHPLDLAAGGRHADPADSICLN